MDAGMVSAMFTLSGTIVVSTTSILVVLIKTYRNTNAVNDAINHRHSDKLRAYDLLISLTEKHQVLEAFIIKIQEEAEKHEEVHMQIVEEINGLRDLVESLECRSCLRE